MGSLPGVRGMDMMPVEDWESWVRREAALRRLAVPGRRFKGGFEKSIFIDPGA